MARLQPASGELVAQHTYVHVEPSIWCPQSRIFYDSVAAAGQPRASQVEAPPFSQRFPVPTHEVRSGVSESSGISANKKTWI